MKALQFTDTARFVRVILPPYDTTLKQGEELPDYKFELFTCSDAGGKGRGKNFGKNHNLLLSFVFYWFS